MAAPKKYSDELRERATRMAVELRRDPATRNGAIQRVAEQLGIHPESLRGWVKRAEVDEGTRPGTTSADGQRIAQLEKHRVRVGIGCLGPNHVPHRQVTDEPGHVVDAIVIRPAATRPRRSVQTPRGSPVRVPRLSRKESGSPEAAELGSSPRRQIRTSVLALGLLGRLSSVRRHRSVKHQLSHDRDIGGISSVD
jgi:transposase